MPVWTAAQLTAHATQVIGSPSDPTGYTFSGATSFTGNWVVYGDVKISGSFTGPGSITAIGGSITITGSAVLGSTNGVGVSLSALPSGTVTNPGITVKGSHVMSGILYAPAGTITLNGSNVVTGAVVGYHVSTGGSSVVTYDAAQQAAVPVQSIQLVQ
jgi:cytoskeletal protein CcmA (bactofilin family)